MRGALLGLVLMLAVLPARAGDALAGLDACLARLDPVSDVGYARIAARCPELEDALAQGGATPLLPQNWKEPEGQLGVPALQQLRLILARQQNPAPALHAAPDPAHAAAITATLRTAAADGWWQRFKGWLRQLFTPHQEEAEGSWMEKVLEELGRSQAIARIIVWSTLAVVIALAAWVVFNELRAAGLLGAAGPRLRPNLPAGNRPGRELTLEQVEGAEPSAQPGLLLELIAARLVALGRLPPARAFTARELLRRARLPEEPLRAPLENLTGVYERVRFSGQPLPPATLAAALAGGRSALAHLELAGQSGAAT